MLECLSFSLVAAARGQPESWTLAVSLLGTGRLRRLQCCLECGPGMPWRRLYELLITMMVKTSKTIER